MKTELKSNSAVSDENKIITGADLLVELLIKEGVDTIFGYPGGAVLPIYDALYRSDADFKHVLSRHEQGSIFAAEGYARVTGRPGIVLATSGPGATNLITGITDAMMDSLPLVVFTGQVSKQVIGTDAFQEADLLGITTPITKYNYQVDNVAELPRIIREAFHIATTGRPGPVVIDFPKNIAEGISEVNYDTTLNLPGYQPTTKPNPLQIVKLSEALSNSKKPVVLAGAGVLFSKASEELLAFIEKYELPIVNTLLGLGNFPGSHELALGMGGMHGSYAANIALHDCDLLINIGARFDDRLTGNLDHFAPLAKVAHIDIDPAEIGKNVPTEIPIVADAKMALQALLKTNVSKPDHAEWKKAISNNQKEFPLWYNESDDFISPQWLMKKIHDVTKGDAIVTTDVGQHQMWTAQLYTLDRPNRWVTSGGLGSMGFGFPSAIGAQFGKPNDLVISISGDGGFQMNLQELILLKQWDLPIKIIIMNNAALGMVRQWQESFYDERYSESLLDLNPDFVKLAESYGIKGMKIRKEADVESALEEIIAYDGPVVADFRTVRSEKVYPMIAPGKGIHEMVGVTKCEE